MKFCLSASQNKETLLKADEIMVNWGDRNSILDLVDLNPQATIILYIDFYNIDAAIQQIKNYHNICKGQFIALVPSIDLIKECVAANIKCGMTFVTRDYQNLYMLYHMGARVFTIGGLLAHDLSFIKQRYPDIEFHICVNNAEGQPDGSYSGVSGGWFRPEDMDELSNYIDVCQFDSESTAQERALYKIYAQDKAWPGLINLLIHNLYVNDTLNNALPENFFERRKDCKQRCLSGGHCQFCNITLHIAERNVLNTLKNNVKDINGNSI